MVGFFVAQPGICATCLCPVFPQDTALCTGPSCQIVRREQSRVAGRVCPVVSSRLHGQARRFRAARYGPCRGLRGREAHPGLDACPMELEGDERDAMHAVRHRGPPARPLSYLNLWRIAGATPCSRQRTCGRPGRATPTQGTVGTTAVPASWAPSSCWSPRNAAIQPRWRWPRPRS
jgi:hypothetical protein